MHVDPVVPLLFDLAVILAAAKLGGWLANRAGQPAVLGELVIGVLLGNLGLVGFHGLESMKTDPVLSILAALGVIVLLFEVGLESTVRQMLQVGPSSLLVAILGVVTPFGLGWAVGAWLLPGHPAYVHAFLGAVLTATSVGITARVLRDIDRASGPEAKIILGAAVVDDVLGLVILSVVSGVISAANAGGEGFRTLSVLAIVGKALAFLVTALVLGALMAPRLLGLVSRVRIRGIFLTSGLIFCFVLSFLAAKVGLAPIVGAFAAGLVLEAGHFRKFDEARDQTLESLLIPISTFLVPVFFVLMGIRVELATFADARVLGLAAALTAVAILGKQVCSLGVLERGRNRLAVGVGMIPRGEVGLIFANAGTALVIHGERVITPATYSAVVIMVIVTTLATPPALLWAFRAGERRRR